MTGAAELALDFPELGPAPIDPLSTPPRLSVAPAPARSADSDTIVARPRLLEQLEQAGRVAVVSAPAGSGKTSLLRSWIREAGLDAVAAWLPLGPEERDPQRFWLSLLDALRHTEAGSAVLGDVTKVPNVDGWASVESLLADLARLEGGLWLIIDDVDELSSSETLCQLELLLARGPVELRFALSTRRDLPLGVHRLRLNGELTELRDSDLRFSLDEARTLFEAVGVRIPESALSVLVDRTEGWAAGLRLAAISLAQHPDPERFANEFSGSERTVAEYLLAEVLERLPAEVRELLVRTSVLDRVSGPLADHLTGGSGSERILQELEEANAFVTSLDARRSWFRYHRLFADLLRLELRRAAPGSEGSLHRAAAQWYEQEGCIVEAIQHAQAARDWPLASRQLADNALDLIFDGRRRQVCELLSAFPSDVAAADPELALVFATERLLDGDREESTAYVDLAQRRHDAVPEVRRHRFDLVLAGLNLGCARWRGDLGTALDAFPMVEATLAAQPAGERTFSDAFRTDALLNRGVAELWSSRFEDARRDLEEALVLARRAGRPWLEISCLGHLGIAGPCTGLSISEGLQLTEEAARIAEERSVSEDSVIVTAMAAGTMVLLWLGRLAEAERWLERAERTLRPDGEPGIELVVHHARGVLRLAQGRHQEALAAFRSAGRMQTLLAGRHALAVPSQARLLQTHACMGHLATARAALAEISDEDRDAGEVRLAAAVIHLAEQEPEHAVDVLGPVIGGVARTIHRSSTATEAQVLDAVAREQLGDTHGAEASLERALELAEPEGIILPFILSPVQNILERLPRHRTAHAALRQTILDVLAGDSPSAHAEAVPLLDELSQAELRIVRYLPTNLRAPEIASELCVSTNTIRTHQRHIYAKLGAHGRAEAVARARQLGLLAPSHRRR
jgi:LuxR family maltose regulon positive regulatory protein